MYVFEDRTFRDVIYGIYIDATVKARLHKPIGKIHLLSLISKFSQHSSNMTSPSVHPLPTPIKGQADWRKYKAFRLENGVTCLVINDKESKTTAMSCIVAVGASSDPRSMSGLAHFCEHMW
jgi:hypothetical protein